MAKLWCSAAAAVESVAAPASCAFQLTRTTRNARRGHGVLQGLDSTDLRRPQRTPPGWTYRSLLHGEHPLSCRALRIRATSSASCRKLRSDPAGAGQPVGHLRDRSHSRSGRRSFQRPAGKREGFATRVIKAANPIDRVIPAALATIAPGKAGSSIKMFIPGR